MSKAPKSFVVHDVAEGLAVLGEMKLPIALRAAYALSRAGTTVVSSFDQFQAALEDQLSLSPTSEVRLEELVEFETSDKSDA